MTVRAVGDSDLRTQGVKTGFIRQSMRQIWSHQRCNKPGRKTGGIFRNKHRG